MMKLTFIIDNGWIAGRDRLFGLTTPLPRAWPPPPHDPRERVVLCRAGDWQVRAFLATDPRFAYLAPRGLWHLQLWHPRAAVSVLTPSGLTLDRYEVYPVAGWKRAVPCLGDVRALLEVFHGIQPPSAGTLAALEAQFVHDPVARAISARRSPAPAPGGRPVPARSTLPVERRRRRPD
jgi:hypothetical protein